MHTCITSIVWSTICSCLKLHTNLFWDFNQEKKLSNVCMLICHFALCNSLIHQSEQLNDKKNQLGLPKSIWKNEHSNKNECSYSTSTLDKWFGNFRCTQWSVSAVELTWISIWLYFYTTLYTDYTVCKCMIMNTRSSI